MTPRLGPGRVIAVWGASAIDRVRLAEALAQRFVQRGVPAVTLGSELTTPAASTPATPAMRAERLARAQDCRRRIDVARMQALVVAAHSPLALMAEARDSAAGDLPASLISDERSHAFTLLLAPSSTAEPETQALDARLRAAFTAAGLPCAVIHGRDDAQRLARAWSALQSGLDAHEDAPTKSGRMRSPAWNCERCSDPECEHRLFTDLLATRDARPAG